MKKIFFIAAMLLAVVSCGKITIDEVKPAENAFLLPTKGGSPVSLEGNLYSCLEYDLDDSDATGEEGINSVMDYHSYIYFKENRVHIFYGRHDRKNNIFRVSEYGTGAFAEVDGDFIYTGKYPQWMPSCEKHVGVTEDGKVYTLEIYHDKFIKDVEVLGNRLNVTVSEGSEQKVKEYELRKEGFDLGETKDMYYEISVSVSVQGWQNEE